ncbi:MAG TPA: aldo/keto reductase [Propionibacteriaceae bacterium]|nr:aldo/keto reductase [Propionibacteriaceae bacterium]
MSALTDTFPLTSGTTIPKIGFGTWLLKEGDECYDAVTEALKAGYRHIDTARAYHNEASVGRAVRDSGIPREEVFVTSKVPAEAKSYGAAVEQFEITMREIGLDYLDLLLIHAPWPWNERGKDCRAENKEVWHAMESFVADGRVRAIGISNFTRADIESLLPACTIIPAVDQIQWYIGHDVEDTVAACAEHGIVVEAYSPFAHGRIVNHPDIVDMGRRYEVSAPQLSMRYLLQKGAVPLPKATSPEHIRANAEVDFEISDADMAVLDALRDTESHPAAATFRWS